MNVRFSFFYDVILTRAEISKNYGWFDRHSTDVSIVLLLLAGNLNFKFRMVFWNIFFWRFEKHIALSEKKPPL